MSLRFNTTSPNKLLDSFKKAIDEGKVVTWSYDQDGDFTHTPDQWKNLAWLRPHIIGNELVLTIIKPKGQTISSLAYAVYHGRFLEAMLNHCDSEFTNATASAYPSDGDIVS